MIYKKTYGTLVAAIALLVGGLLIVPGMALAQQGGHHPDQAKAEAAEPATQTAKCEMCKSMMDRMKTMAKLKELLAEAKGAAEAEGATKAGAKVDEAMKLIAEQHKGMHDMMQKHMQKMHKGMMGKGMMDKSKVDKGKMGNGMTDDEMKCPMCSKMMGQADEGKVVNARCPIMGNKLDRANVPDTLTREWKGKTVGFCCAACPPKWEKLSDEEKKKKLDAAMAKPEKDDESAEAE